MNPDRYRLALFALAWILACCLQVASAAEKPAPDTVPVPPPVPFVFPEVVEEPDEPIPPKPPVRRTLTIRAGEIYAVPWNQAFILKAYPAGLVKLKPIKTPATLYGVFAGGNGEDETREYAGGFLFVVKAEKGKEGQVTLVQIPVGVKDADSVTDMLIDIGVAPQPPPGPTPPEPKPEPQPAPLTAAKLWIVNIYPSGKMSPALQQVLLNQQYLTAVEARGHKYTNMATSNPVARRFDSELAAKKQALPATLIFDLSSGLPMATVPTPATTAAMDALISKYTTPGQVHGR